MAYQLEMASRLRLKCYKLRSAALKLRIPFGNFIVHIRRQTYEKFLSLLYANSPDAVNGRNYRTVGSQVCLSGNGLQWSVFCVYFTYQAILGCGKTISMVEK